MLFNLSVGLELASIELFGSQGLFKSGSLTGWNFSAYTYLSSFGWFASFACFWYFTSDQSKDTNLIDTPID